jgi:hypothetical protein
VIAMGRRRDCRWCGFAPQPVIRFDGVAQLGDLDVVYEFNVKIQCMLPSSARHDEWAHEVDVAREEFELRLANKYPWLRVEGFTGRSGGWLAIRDTAGRMTEPRLHDVQRRVAAALERFKKRMVRKYPRRPQ